MEITQILLFTVVTILTLLLVAIGVQVFVVFKEVKKTILKLNKLLDDANILSGSIAKPVMGIVNILEGIKNIKHLIDFVSEKKVVQDEEAQDITPEEHHGMHRQIKSLQERGRRFFHRDGKPLTS